MVNQNRHTPAKNNFSVFRQGAATNLRLKPSRPAYRKRLIITHPQQSDTREYSV